MLSCLDPLVVLLLKNLICLSNLSNLSGRITLGRNMASLEAHNGAGKIHTMERNLPVQFNELPVNIMIPC
jgi:hypothetical protein